MFTTRNSLVTALFILFVVLVVLRVTPYVYGPLGIVFIFLLALALTGRL